MSYLVLARKHRPSTFHEVVGQEHITRTLAGALATGRLAHAFIFTGPRGVGKTSVARILAKAVNCENGPTDKPCGQCVVCREIDEGRAVDVQEIDAASNSRVEDVRELREVIRYRPQSARFRVTILDEVHMLSKAAFNALLKTLEEPPDHAIFILATTDVHKVPLTILSRCQRYDFRRLPPRVLAEHLANVLAAEGASLPPQSLALISREADGSVRDSLSLLDQVLSAGQKEMTHQEVVELLGLVDRELVRKTAGAILSGDSGRALDLVGQVYAAGGEMQAYYGALQEHFRNLAAAKAAPAGSELFGLTDEELAELRAQAGETSAETLHEVFDQLARSEELFRRSGQPRLVMEMTLLKLTQLKPVISLEDILAGLAKAGASPAGGTAARPAPSPANAARAPSAAPPQAPSSGAPPSAPRAMAAPAAEPAPEPECPLPPAQGGNAPSDPKEALAKFTAYSCRSEPVLAGYLGRSRAAWQGGDLVVTLPAGSLTHAQATSENEGKLTRLWRELFGAGAVKLKAPKPPESAPARLAKRAEVAADLVEHPAVREAMEVFQAEVVSLNPAEKES